MPLQWRLQVVQAKVNESLGMGVRLVEASLFGLVEEERNAALDGLASGLQLPFVIGLGSLICTGAINAEAIVEAVQRSGFRLER